MPYTYPITWPTAADTSFVADNGNTYWVKSGLAYAADGIEPIIIGGEHYRFYDETYIVTNYRVDEAGNVYLLDENGYPNPVITSFTETFAGDQTVLDTVGVNQPWNSVQLLSPEYVSVNLQNRKVGNFFSGESDITENEIDIVNSVTPDTSWPENCTSNRVGEACVFTDYVSPRVIRFMAPKPTGKAFVTKTDLSTGLLFYKENDTVTITAWFYLESGHVATLLDLESSYYVDGGGLRVFLNQARAFKVERAKLEPSLDWSQAGTPVVLPYGVWTKVEFEMFLKSDSSGSVLLKIDDVTVISGTGQTLWLSDTVYNRIQAGLTANDGNSDCVLYMKDLSVVKS